MTDKIIIDGVDVSKCEYINCCDKKTKCIILQDDICADSQYCKGCNCYYKQLKQVEKENEQLKEVAAKRLIEKGVFISTLDKLRKIIDEKLEKENKLINTLQDIKTLVTTDYIQIKRQLVQNYDLLDNFMQKIEDKCSEVID